MTKVAEPTFMYEAEQCIIIGDTWEGFEVMLPVDVRTHRAWDTLDKLEAWYQQALDNHFIHPGDMELTHTILVYVKVTKSITYCGEVYTREMWLRDWLIIGEPVTSEVLEQAPYCV